jgi:small subunit ribosomal protein S18
VNEKEEEKVTEVSEEAAPPEAEQVAEPEARQEPTPVAGEQREQGPPPRERRRSRYVSRRKVCFFCAEKISDISYKNVDMLRRYLSDRAKIEPRRKTGTCAKHQRRLTAALKHARHLALLPYTAEHIRVSGSFSPRG